MRSKFAALLLVFLAFSLALTAQIQPIPNLTVQPVPIPGGDLVPGFGIANLFFPGPPGQTPPFDPMGAEPQAITNFKGLTAMGYTSGLATDNTGKQWLVITDIRVYKGAYIGGKAADPVNTAGATSSAKANGIFVEIWLDLWDPSLGIQMHDFSPWQLPNGLFWTVKVDDTAVQINGDTLTIHLVDVPVVDAFSFPPPVQAVPGISPIQLIPARLSFDIVYTKAGNRRQVQRGSQDPLSPFSWAGAMWDATNAGTFSLTYDDGSFSASGGFQSNGNFGQMGFEKNGVFLTQDDNNTDAEAQLNSMPDAPQTGAKVANSTSNQTPKTVLLKGRVPVNVN